MVEKIAEALVLLGFVDSSIGCTVHDSVNGVPRHKRLYGLLVGDIQLLDSRIKENMLGMGFLQQLHLVT
jgi:hypothetical protein